MDTPLCLILIRSKTLQRDFSRFEEIRVLRATIEKSEPEASSVKREEPDARSTREIKRISEINRLLAETAKKRKEILGNETFEPIDIEYGFEDSVLYDSEVFIYLSYNITIHVDYCIQNYHKNLKITNVK